MTTHSLLDNIEQIKSLKLRKLSIPDSETTHADIQWIGEQYLKWSDQFSVNNRHIDSTLILFSCGLFGPEPQKEYILKAIKAIEILYYIDLYLTPARKNKSAEEAKEMVGKLINALKTEQCNKDFSQGTVYLS